MYYQIDGFIKLTKGKYSCTINSKTSNRQAKCICSPTYHYNWN